MYSFIWRLFSSSRRDGVRRPLINEPLASASVGRPASVAAVLHRVKTALPLFIALEGVFPPTCIHLQLIVEFIYTLLWQPNEALPWMEWTFVSLRLHFRLPLSFTLCLSHPVVFLLTSLSPSLLLPPSPPLWSAEKKIIGQVSKMQIVRVC